MLEKTTLANLSFSGHETFVFRYTWLKKAVDAVTEDPRIFTRDDAIVKLGVGKNMVRSIRHWSLAAGVIEEIPKSRGIELRSTQLGQFLFGSAQTLGADPFLEDPNTLWLLHWELINNPARATTWKWAFGLLPSNEFSREALLQLIEDELRRLNVKQPSEHTLSRDIDVFVRTYATGRPTRGVALEDSLDCPLTELNLIEEIAGTSQLKMRRGPKSNLANRVFAFCLQDFWNRKPNGTTSLAFSEIAYSPGSPGSVFKLDENSLVERLESLEVVTNGALGYAEGAGLKQVYRPKSCDGFEWLFTEYQNTNPVLMGV